MLPLTHNENFKKKVANNMRTNYKSNINPN